MTRSRVIIAAAVPGLVLISAFSVWLLAREPGESVRVEHGDLVIGVEVSGSLRAIETSHLGPPSVRDLWQFKIAMMADEGTEVTAGQPVLAFDPSELRQRLQTKLAELDAARTEVEKKNVDIAVTIANDRLQLAEVEARLRKARLIADQPSRLHADTEVQKAKLDLELAELEVDLVRRRIDATRRAGEEELGVLEANFAQATAEVEHINDGIRKMQRTAPRDGIVIHVTNWRNEKKKVGDGCYRSEKVLEIPDLSRMEADGEVKEAEAGRLRPGQSVVLKLDAHPDHEYHAVVESISRAVRQKSWRNPVKVVNLTLSLAETDPERMRPGMRFRGSVEVEKISDVTLIPVEVIFRENSVAVVYRRSLGVWRSTPVEIGARNTEMVEILSGVEPGDLVSLKPRL